MEVTYPPSSTASAPAGSQAAPERVIQYSNREMDVLDLAWATTVHKAQGGEAKAVLLALSPTHRPLLSRRLLYTGDSACTGKSIFKQIKPVQCLFSLVRILYEPPPLRSGTDRYHAELRTTILLRRHPGNPVQRDL